MLGDSMGRELKRKEAKKNNKNVKEIVNEKQVDTQDEVYKLVKILTIVLLVLLAVYLLVGIFITKEIKFGNSKDKTDTNIISTNILAGETFKQSEEKYFVYFYDFKNTISAIDNAMVSKLSGHKIYKVDMSSAFNSKYVSEVGNNSVQKIEDLKIVNPTLILIENDVNVKYVEGESAILNYINSN